VETVGVVCEGEKMGEGDQVEGLVFGVKIPSRGGVGAVALVLKERFRFSFRVWVFFVFFFSKLPPFSLCELCTYIYR
jgi:hypothetical protein